MNFFIYIIHNYKLKERKKYLLDLFSCICNYKFIEIENINDNIIGEYYHCDDNIWINKCINLYDPYPPPRKLVMGEIACTASHLYALNDFMLNRQEDWILVLEDDAILQSNFNDEINLIINKCPSNIDCIFIGGGFYHESVSVTKFTVGNFYYKNHPSTNTTVAYLVKRSFLTTLLDHFTSFTLPIDYELAYHLKATNAIVAHYIPYLVSEGSKDKYKSSLASLLDR